MKGYGKSTYLRRVLSDSRALAVVDTLAEHADWCPPCPAVSIREQVEWLASPPETFRASFLLAPESASAHFNGLAKAAFHAGDLTFAVEEVDFYSGPMGDEPGLEILFRYGRHRAVNLVWITRNLAEVSRKLTSQTDIFVLFRTQEPRYIEGLAERLSPEIAEEVESLPKFEYVIASKDAQPERKRL